MEIIKTINEGLEDLPQREVYYFGTTSISCSEKIIVKHRDYTFEIFKYDIKGNGVKYVKMFDSENKQIFENLSIVLHYCWVAGLTVEFFNEYHPNSNRYFKFVAKTDFGLESVLSKLVLMAEKRRLIIKYHAPFQHVYAYIVFLFFQTNEKKIRASEFSHRYNILMKMRACISGELTDNVNNSTFSKDTVYYKAFDRFLSKQLEAFKNKPIIYDS